MPNYENIPGVSVELQDSHLSTATATEGVRILIIGEVPATLTTVPEEPVLVRNVETLNKYFGGYAVNGKDNPLAIEWKGVMDETKANVYLLALKGETVKDKYLNLYHQLFGFMMDMQFDHVVLAGGLYADVYTDALTMEDFESPEDQELFPALPGIQTIIEPTPPEGGGTREGVATHVGSPAHLVAKYAEEQSLYSNETIAYIGVTAPTGFGVRDISNYVSQMTARENQCSKFVQVVVGPQHGVTVETSLTTKWASGAAIYAAQVARLPITNAPTNQPLKSVTRLRWLFSQRQINALVGKKYVTFTIKDGSAVVVDGVTSAPDLVIGDNVQKSDFTRLSTLRSINDLANRVRVACDSFIGSTAGFPTYSALKTAIKTQIDEAITEGAISNASFSLEMADASRFDSVTIKLTVIPTFELRKIKVVIGLSDPVNYSTDESTPS